MAEQPFSESGDRPDLTVDMGSKVGDLTVRQLSDILGQALGSQAKLKQAAAEKPQKENFVEKFTSKDIKDGKDSKDNKEHKDQKESKDAGDAKDAKDHKDGKDSSDSKVQRDHKYSKDHKDHKESKDGYKEALKERDHIPQVPQKQDKDQKDSAEQLKDLSSEGPGKGPVESGSEGGVGSQPGIEELVQRVTGLEQDVARLKQAGQGTSG